MIVTLVSDVLGAANNGTNIAALNLINYLRGKGYDVRIVCPDASMKGQINYYVVPTRSFGIFDFIVEANEVALAKGDSLVLMRAIKEADVVHIMTPLTLGKKAAAVATHLHKPITAGFHFQAENVTSHFFNFQHIKIINHWVYLNFYNKLFRYVDAIHYPTQFIRDVFEKDIRRSTPGHVISNGVKEVFRHRDVVRPKELEGKYLILMSGRYSKEKNQKLLIKAVAKSKYKDGIAVIFAGSGPRLKPLKKLSDKLIPGQVQYRFYDWDSLVDALSMSDLYVHTSSIEIEAISCLEAIATGLVPLINNAKGSATRYFALHPENLFKEDDYKDLSRKIDWYIEHPEKKEAFAKEYADYSKQFDFAHCMEQMEKMILEAVEKKKHG